MAIKEFHFVPMDGPKRQGNKRPETQRYATAARKHAMKDIGFARRKHKTDRRASRYKTFELELVDGGLGPQSEYRPWCDLPIIGEQGGPAAAFRLSGLAGALGSGRLDPFVKYPVSMDDRARTLLDTRKCTEFA